MYIYLSNRCFQLKSKFVCFGIFAVRVSTEPARKHQLAGPRVTPPIKPLGGSDMYPENVRGPDSGTINQHSARSRRIRALPCAILRGPTALLTQRRPLTCNKKRGGGGARMSVDHILELKRRIGRQPAWWGCRLSCV